MSERAVKVFCVIMFVVGALIGGYAGRHGGYQQGQLDALDGRWRYERVTTSDGRVHVVDVEVGEVER